MVLILLIYITESGCMSYIFRTENNRVEEVKVVVNSLTEAVIYEVLNLAQH